jgi:hypothetical protein
MRSVPVSSLASLDGVVPTSTSALPSPFKSAAASAGPKPPIKLCSDPNDTGAPAYGVVLSKTVTPGWRRIKSGLPSPLTSATAIAAVGVCRSIVTPLRKVPSPFPSRISTPRSRSCALCPAKTRSSFPSPFKSACARQVAPSGPRETTVAIGNRRKAPRGYPLRSSPSELGLRQVRKHSCNVGYWAWVVHENFLTAASSTTQKTTWLIRCRLSYESSHSQ